jgi:hypothetical protein
VGIMPVMMVVAGISMRFVKGSAAVATSALADRSLLLLLLSLRPLPSFPPSPTAFLCRVEVLEARFGFIGRLDFASALDMLYTCCMLANSCFTPVALLSGAIGRPYGYFVLVVMLADTWLYFVFNSLSVAHVLYVLIFAFPFICTPNGIALAGRRANLNLNIGARPFPSGHVVGQAVINIRTVASLNLQVFSCLQRAL